ncbi:LysR family transcriptional regulator [Pseudoalteromonas sp. SIMBA_153]
MKLSLDEMATFVEVVNCGNFSKAAEKTGIPVSTISRRISDLEQRLKTQLLYRTTRKQSLSDIGKIYFKHCSQMLREAEAAELAIQNLKAEPSGKLRITTPYVFEDPFASNMMKLFMVNHPKIEVDYVVSLRKVDLIEEGFDCALIPGFLNDSSLRTKGLGEFKIVHCASPEYIENYGLPTVDSLLDQHYLIKLNYPNWLNIPFDEHDNKMQSRLSTNDLYVARRSAAGGLGIANLPEAFALEQIKNGTLIKVLPEFDLTAPFNLVFPSNKQFTTKLRAFIDHIANFAENFAPWCD